LLVTLLCNSLQILRQRTIEYMIRIFMYFHREWWWWRWLMFYSHFCAPGRLNGPSDLQRVMKRSERWRNLQICPRRNSNTGGSDIWSNTLPIDHGGAPCIFTEHHSLNCMMLSIAICILINIQQIVLSLNQFIYPIRILHTHTHTHARTPTHTTYIERGGGW